ncbi:hypothetical protein EON83_21940 [bacterium]|nr:MAG: hypothetical protein EON83_21940 [bacterium]
MDSASKKSLTVGLGAIVIVFVVGSGLYYQKQRAALMNMSKPRIAPGNMPAAFKTQKEQEALERVKQLRTVWRDKWALPHKNLLLTMQRARPDDDAAWINVVNTLPYYRQMADLGMQLNNKEESNPRNMGNPDYVIASWQGGPWPVKAARPEMAEEAKKISEGIKKTREEQLAQWHDIKLSEVGSIAADRVCCLWVSGRVTWRQKMPTRTASGTQTLLTFPKDEQIFPPYEFLDQG